MASGTVRWYDDERGIGFIAPDDGGEDAFCCAPQILADGCWRSLGDGQKVEFDVGPGDEGPVALNVRRIFGADGQLVTVLCGDAVQVKAYAWGRPNLAKMGRRLAAFGEVRVTDLLVRLRAPPHELTLFDDGRAIVKGTNDADLARSLASTWLGVKLVEDSGS